jgi:N-acetylglucosaminyl-diphospho-decaprenol L-rhamnosyltransferase
LSQEPDRGARPRVEDAGGRVGTIPDVSHEAVVEAVVVNHNAGEVLLRCLRSLRGEGPLRVTLVDNASRDGSAAAASKSDPSVFVVELHENLGYGAGANRGLERVRSEFVLVSNPDVEVHPGAIGKLTEALRSDSGLAIAGPRIEEPDGSRYPSARRFPSTVDAAGHALLGQLVPNNRFTRRYKMSDLDPSQVSVVDWVSGACFLARRQALVELGGFDEAYFMYVEDLDLCWRARRAGWQVAHVPTAVVTHLRGVSTARHPFRMLLAHHRSALRFASRTTTGWRRAGLPAVAVVMGLRLAGSFAVQLVSSWRNRVARRAD